MPLQDKRIQLLENEVERLKTVAAAKEGRMEDLERQHQVTPRWPAWKPLNGPPSSHANPLYPPLINR